MDEQELAKLLAKTNQDTAKEITRLITELKKAPVLSSTQVKRVNDSLQKLAKDLKLEEKENKKLLEVIKDVVEVKEKEIKATKDLNERFYTLYRQMGKTELAAQASADQAEENVKTLKNFGAAAGEVYKAAAKGSGDITDFSNVFKGRLGYFGAGLQNFGEFAQTSLDAFRTLSNVGANFGQNLFALRETAASAALPLQDFVKLISANSESLALLYGTTTQGAKRFALLSEQFRRTSIERLAPLGFTVDQLNEVLLTTVNLQRRTGSFQEGAVAEQIQSAEAFAVELDKLAKLTGQQRNQMLKQMESQLSNDRFMAFLSQQTNEKTKQSLQGFVASIHGLAPGLTEGFSDLIANAGTPVTEASRMLVQNIHEAPGIIQQLSAGAIDSTTALQMLRDAAQRSNKALAGVAVTGQVGFARLFAEVNKLASAKLDERVLTEEQKAAQEKATKALAMFEDASKTLSSSFQNIETGFYTTLGGFIGTTGGLLNNAVKGIANGINALHPGIQAMLFVGKTLGGYFLDKAGQILTTGAGTALGIRMSGGLGGGIGNTNFGVGSAGNLGHAGKALAVGSTLAGGAGVIGGTAAAAEADTFGGKAAGVGTAAMSGAITGASIGMFAGPKGALIGAAIGGLVGGGAALIGAGMGKDIKRSTGTFGTLGLPFEPKTSMLHVEAGERVLNKQETQDYNQGGQNSAQMAQLTSQMTQYNMTAKEALELQRANHQALNTLVSINAATEKNTKKTSKVVDKVGSSIV
jgi:hypothetical protein